MIIIKHSDIHGKGAFAAAFIEKDTILECDILQVNNGNYLTDYLYPFKGNSVCLHIGFASFLNSCDTPNLKHLGINTEKKISYFKVLEDVESGTELTLNYAL